jgi:inner membrane transporter RhtA
MLSTAPAVAALAGFFVLGEWLSVLQWTAIALVMMASFGNTMSASRSDA